MPPFAAWNESRTVTRHGYKTSDGEGKIKFDYYIDGKAVGP